MKDVDCQLKRGDVEAHYGAGGHGKLEERDAGMTARLIFKSLMRFLAKIVFVPIP